jgi:hypothetical protein
VVYTKIRFLHSHGKTWGKHERPHSRWLVPRPRLKPGILADTILARYLYTNLCVCVLKKETKCGGTGCEEEKQIFGVIICFLIAIEI